MTFSLTDLEDGGFRFAGRIDPLNAGTALDHGLREFAKYRDITVDLGPADIESTVGIALLIEWSTATQTRGRHVSYVNASPRLIDLLRVNGIEKLLNISPAWKKPELATSVTFLRSAATCMTDRTVGGLRNLEDRASGI